MPQSSLLGSKPAQVTVFAGARVRVRLAETLSTKRNQKGDKFRATLDEPIVQGDKVVVPKGTTFQGHVISSANSGRLKGRAELGLPAPISALCSFLATRASLQSFFVAAMGEEEAAVRERDRSLPVLVMMVRIGSESVDALCKGIKMITAYSPQACGRSKRSFRTSQGAAMVIELYSLTTTSSTRPGKCP